MKFRILLIGIFLISAIVTLTGFSNKISVDILQLKAPEKFKAKFETTKGDFEITAERKLSPLAVDRLYQLIKSGYFKDIPIYRVAPKFVAQFGTLDTLLDNAWSENVIIDEPVLKSNETGTISFARAGKNSRGSQLFINLRNNARLDTVSYGQTLGFPVVAYVSDGMDVVKDFYDGYNDEPRNKMDSTVTNVPEYLKKNFPKLDYIKSAVIID